MTTYLDCNGIELRQWDTFFDEWGHPVYISRFVDWGGDEALPFAMFRHEWPDRHGAEMGRRISRVLEDIAAGRLTRRPPATTDVDPARRG